VVRPAGPHVDERGAQLEVVVGEVRAEAFERGWRAADEVGAPAVEGVHVLVVGRVGPLVKGPGDEGHELGGGQVRVREALLAHGGDRLAAAGGGAEGAAPVGRVDGEVVGEVSQPDVDGLEGLEGQVGGQV